LEDAIEKKTVNEIIFGTIFYEQGKP
jgi:hypothetical protein